MLVSDGADGADGSDGSDGGDGNSVFYASCFRRASSAPSTPTGGSYNFTSKTLTPPASWFAEPPAVNGDPLYISTSIAEINGTTGTDSTLTWSTPAELVTDGADGADGSDGADGTDPIVSSLTNPAHVVDADSDGTGYSLTGAGGTHEVLQGTTDRTTSATHSVVGSATKNGLTISVNSSGVYSLSGGSWTSNSETFTLRAVYGGVTMDKTYVISKSKAGADGSGGATIGDLSNFALTDNDALDDNDGTATVGFRVDSDGDIYTRPRESTGYSSAQTWKGDGAAGDYEVKVTKISQGRTTLGDASNLNTGTLNTWQLCSTDRTYEVVSTSADKGGYYEVAFRRTSDNILLATIRADLWALQGP